MHPLQDRLENEITRATDTPFNLAALKPLSGGCIHDAKCCSGTDDRRFFIKENKEELLPSFLCEQAALTRMAATRSIRVPKPVAAFGHNGRAVLILEYLPMGGNNRDWQRMGADLARLHAHTGKAFGWDADNFIGVTPQKNAWIEDWIAFYAEYRLQPQLALARAKGLDFRHAQDLLHRLPRFFDDYRPEPALLHGDLWSGNAGFLEDGTPVVFDPAAYFGDPEADLALTELFGGYPPSFYEGYRSVRPINAGYGLRRDLYNLYHVLNHFNIFGGGYGQQAGSMIRQLVQSVP